MAIYRIGTDQPGGVHHHCLPGTTQFTVGQQGTNTMDPYMDAYEAHTGVDMEMQGIGLPNNLGTPTSQLNNLGTSHKRFTVFALPMVPYGSGSMDRLVNSSTYDTLHNNVANAVVAAGFGLDSAVRCGHEYNAGAGQAGNYNWAVGHIDPFTGLANTLGNYKLGAAKVEGIWRAAGYTGRFAWSGGTGDTSAAPIASAIPTHGDPRLTVWDWDWYSRIGWDSAAGHQGSKQTGVMAAFAQDKATDDGYLSYCRANGLLMAHSEYGQNCRTDSPYATNDTALWYPAFYKQLADNAMTKAWAGHYQVNQFNGSVVREHHLVALSVSTSGGSPSGVAAAAKWTGDWPPGASGPINTYGRTPTLAEMGSLQSSSNAGLHWVWSNDPNKQSAVSSWRGSFGDIGAAAGKGTAGLSINVTPPVVPPTHTVVLPRGRKVRRQYKTFR